MKISPLIPPILLFCIISTAARADSVQYDNKSFPDLSVKGVGKSGLVVQINGTLHAMDLAKVTLIQIQNADKFNAAESARADTLKALPLYEAAIREINDPPLKQLAQLRALPLLQSAGKWTDAVDTFLAVYTALPTDPIWSQHPTQLPDPGSSMLVESAQHIESKIPTLQSTDPAQTAAATRNLKIFAMQIYTRANDPRGQQLARELATGETTPTPTPQPTPQQTDISTSIADIQSDIKSKNYATALTKASALLDTATGDAAVQLFILRAIAYQNQNQPAAAVAELLRIPAHYPASPLAPSALYQAAQIEKSQNHPDQSQSLLTEILTRYPDSPAAARVKVPEGSK